MESQLSPSPQSAWVGIDVSKARLDVVWLRAGRHAHRVFANTSPGFEAMLAWWQASRIDPVRICLEATGSYSDALAHFLAAHGLPVCVLNPAILVAYRKSEQVRRKDDRTDASLLARWAISHQPRLWQPLPEPIWQLRLLLNRREDLLRMRGQERHRLQAGRLTPWSAAHVQTHLAWLQQAIRTCERQIWLLLRQEPCLLPLWHRLQTIAGIGKLSAAALIAHIGQIERFEQVGALVSLAGLATTTRQSGTSVLGRPHIDRHGRRDLRSLLYWCAITAMRVDPQIAAWADRLRQRGKPKKVIIVAVIRKLLHLVYGVWKSGRDYDPTKVLGPAA
ncbi:MAG: IS110 family transposase [Ktedonobacteraceae bacterium]|nr:IS110 family transposase [Ktedonobacteraceae bacterium]MBO0792227.1 IS110 family transposase [Ktedonobacteraceae bacterium]